MRIDWDALVRGWPIDGEVCEISGLGPVAVSAVRAMVAQSDTNRVMDELWELGARAILVTSIHACRS